LKVVARAVGLWILGVAPVADALTLTVDPPAYGLDSYAVLDVADAGVYHTEYLAPGSTSGSATHTVASGNNVSTLRDSLSNDGIRLEFDHARDGDPNAGAYAHAADSYGAIFFSVDADVDYRIDGEYAAVDPDGRLVLFRVTLMDETLCPDPAHPLPGAVRFSNYQESRSTPNESFQLGLFEGDYGNGPFGDPGQGLLVGVLTAGHVYGLYWDTAIAAHEPASSPATASGFVQIVFLPEPDSTALLAAGIVALAAGHRARSPAQRRE